MILHHYKNQFVLCTILFIFTFVHSHEVKNNSILEENIATIGKLKPFSLEWRTKVKDFLSETMITPNTENEEEGKMRFISNMVKPISKAAMSYFTYNVTSDPETYDYIVVGCGATGCPLAAILAKNKMKVLVLERGQERSHERTADAMDAYGAGIGVNDPSISQPIITDQGVRTHVATVMGGGTSINLAIMIQELKDYFDYLETFPGVKYDYDLMQKAFTYSHHISANDMPPSQDFTNEISNGLANQGFQNLGDSSLPNYSDKLNIGYRWSSESLFNSQKSFYRNASDTYLLDPSTGHRYSSLTVKTQSTVERVEFDETTSPPTARCVIYHPTTLKDILATGSEIPGFPSFEALNEFFSTFLNPLAGIQNIQEQLQSFFKKRRRVCLNKGGKIILSAGALFSPVLLYTSGVGPREQVELLGIPLIKEHPTLGQAFSDRVFVPVNAFLKAQPTIPVESTGNPAVAQRETHINSVFGISESELISRENLYNIAVETADKALKLGMIREEAERLAAEAASEAAANDEISKRFVGIIPTLLRPFFDNKSTNSSYPNFPYAISSILALGQPNIFSPRIADVIGAKNVGPDCTNKSLNSRTLTCSLITAEDVYGARIPEGIIYATRFIFPPSMRNDPAVNSLFNVLVSCSRGRKPYNSPILDTLCLIAKPVIACFRRAVAIFYFTAEPKSRGFVKLTNTGELFVSANYLKDEQDLFDAIRGTQNLIQIMNSDVFKGTIEDISDPKACPTSVFNGLLDILLKLMSVDDIIDDPSAFIGVKEHLESLIPQNYDREAQKEDGSKEEKKKIDIRKILRMLSYENPSLRDAVDACASCSSDFSFAETCSKNDVCCTAYGNALCIPLSDDLRESLMEVLGEFKNEPGVREPWYLKMINDISQYTLMTGKQWAATFPPTLADPDDPESVTKYVLQYMTSIWHFANSAPMGQVVDSNFNVIGLEGLSIIDASVLNQIPRMNPTATLLALGVYGAALKLQEKTGTNGPFF